MREKNECPNCKAALMASDASCWQCGWEIVATEANEATLTAPLVEEKSGSTLPALTMGYAALTLFFVVAALALMSWLGSQPMAQTALGAWQEGWHPIDDPNGAFTVDLPPNWEWQLNESGEDTALFFAGSNQLEAFWLSSAAPIGADGANWKPLMMSQPQAADRAQEGDPFLVVFQSVDRYELDLSKLAGMVDDAQIKLHDGKLVDNFDKTHLAMELTNEKMTPAHRCRRQFYAGDQSVIVAIGCHDARAFREFSPKLNQILGSFQRLTH